MQVYQRRGRDLWHCLQEVGGVRRDVCAQRRRYSLYLLYWYTRKKNTDAARRITRPEAHVPQFTCFTGTREQILTLRAASPGPKLTYLEFEQLCRDVVGSGEEGLKTEQVSS